MTWDRLQWGQTDGSDIATRLQTSIDLVSNFYDNLKNDPQVQIERALEQLADEISKGRHETASVGSLSTIAAYDDVDDDSGWEQVIRDLGNHGIQESVVKEYRVFIVDWILRAINSGVLSTEKIPVSPGGEQSWKIPVEQGMSRSSLVFHFARYGSGVQYSTLIPNRSTHTSTVVSSSAATKDTFAILRCYGSTSTSHGLLLSTQFASQ